MINGCWSGTGCCETLIPKGERDFNISITSYNDHKDVLKFNPCSYAFVVKEDTFNFSIAELQGLYNRSEAPFILDWTIGDETCKQAKNNETSYACKGYSQCHDSSGSGIYVAVVRGSKVTLTTWLVA